MPPFIAKKLVDRLPMILTLLIMINLAFFTTLFFYEYSNKKDQIRTNLELNLHNTESKIEEIFSHSETILNKIVEKVKYNKNNRLYIKKTTESLKGQDNIFNQMPWTEFSWIDHKNNITVSSRYGLMKGKINLSKRDYIIKAQKNPGTFYVGNVVTGSTSKLRIIPVGVGASINDEYIGSIVVGINLEPLKETIKNSISDGNIAITVINLEKKLQFSTSDKINFRFDSITNLLIEEADNTRYYSKIDLLGKRITAVAVKKSAKYPFIFIAQYNNNSIKKNLTSSYILRVKMLILIALSVILYLLSSRFVITRFNDK